jgi:hypothetical protein
MIWVIWWYPIKFLDDGETWGKNRTFATNNKKSIYTTQRNMVHHMHRGRTQKDNCPLNERTQTIDIHWVQAHKYCNICEFLTDHSVSNNSCLGLESIRVCKLHKMHPNTAAEGFQFQSASQASRRSFSIGNRDLSMKQINGYWDLGVGRVTPSIA